MHAGIGASALSRRINSSHRDTLLQVVFRAKMSANMQTDTLNNEPTFTTIIGFGSLLSEKSARSTFPDLTGFRVAHVQGFRRVFAHPAAIFFERGIANKDTGEIASLSVEQVGESDHRFHVSVFEIHNKHLDAFHQREEEFHVVPATYHEPSGSTGQGLLCTQGTDDMFRERWGEDAIERKYGVYGISTIWNFPPTQIYPCRVYLRHCVLAARKLGLEEDFVNNTFLADRTTSIAQYLKEKPHILDELPPPSLHERYNG